MRKLGRRPEEIETLNFFAAIDLPKPGQRRALNDRARIDAAVTKFAAGLSNSLNTEPRLHGWRADHLFGLIAADLGNCALVKQEDSGTTYFDGGNIKLPDWRLILKTGAQLLVEVKTIAPEGLPQRARIRDKEVRGLKRYAELEGVDLFIAIYWATLNLWCLLPVGDFIKAGTSLEIDFETAMKRDHMGSLLADRMLGLVPPLTLHLRFSQTERKTTPDGDDELVGTLSEVSFSCGGQVMVTREEEALVWFLLNHARWPIDDGIVDIDPDTHEVRFTMRPEEWDPRQGFAIIGRLSELYSRLFVSQTADENGLHALTVDLEPGIMPRLVPTSFRSKRLPLWHLNLRPAD